MRNHRKPTFGIARHDALLRVLRALVRPFCGSAPGATLIEYMVVAGFVSLFGLLAFNRFGQTLHRAYQEEARHVAGHGTPGAADLLGAIGGLTDPNGVCDLVTGVCIGGGCFSAGTPVSTETGDRPIESILPGERVWARDPETGAVALRTVTKTWIRPEAPIITLDLHDGAFSTERIRVTASHRFWVEGSGWVPAGELAATPLWSTNTSVAASVIAAPPEITTVYNLEVEGYHTYFVGHSRALVHNQTGGVPAPGNCQAPAPGIVPPGGGIGPTPKGIGSMITGLPFTKAEIERCKQEFRKDNGALKSGNSNTRPANSGDILCQLKLEDCANAAEPQACKEKWDCVDEHVAKHPTSTIFKDADAAQTIIGRCTDPGEVSKSCPQASQGFTVSPARQAEIDQAAQERVAAAASGDQTAMRKASERAGEAAAKAFAESQGFPSSSCTFMDGSRVFDGVCTKPTGEVLIIEAKGGSSQLGDRWDADGKTRVQQGRPEYIEAVLADLRSSGDAEKIRVANQIENADDLAYQVVNQKFDGAGNALPPTSRQFELDTAKCPPK